MDNFNCGNPSIFEKWNKNSEYNKCIIREKKKILDSLQTALHCDSEEVAFSQSISVRNGKLEYHCGMAGAYEEPLAFSYECERAGSPFDYIEYKFIKDELIKRNKLTGKKNFGIKDIEEIKDKL